MRNHGFILEETGWKLSPAFDVNPTADGNGLSLNISELDNSQDLKLAMSVVEYFRVNETKAKQIIDEVKSATTKWREHADKLGISKGKQDLMARAFRVSEDK